MREGPSCQPRAMAIMADPKTDLAELVEALFFTFDSWIEVGQGFDKLSQVGVWKVIALISLPPSQGPPAMSRSRGRCRLPDR